MGEEASVVGSRTADSVLVMEVPDVDQAVRELLARGIVFLAQPTDQPGWGIRAAHLRDPEGRLIELMTPLPEDRWSDALRTEDRKYPPISIDLDRLGADDAATSDKSRSQGGSH
jgi:hypothetical protein